MPECCDEFSFENFEDNDPLCEHFFAEGFSANYSWSDKWEFIESILGKLVVEE